MAAAYTEQDPARRYRILVWGTYDLGKPRVRILLDAARRTGARVEEVHVAVWRGVEDKSRLHGRWQRLRYLLRWLFAYPGLILRYLRADPHDLVFIPYMGHADVVLLRPFAAMRRVPVLWDALISMHGTLVEDRGLVAEDSLLAKVLRTWDRLAFRCANRVITGTEARAAQYVSEYGVAADKIDAIFVSAELEHFTANTRAAPRAVEAARPMALFYGQFAPLHGLPTVIEVARSSVGRAFDWVFIGTGQEGWRIDAWLHEEHPAHVKWIRWVPYEQLREWIERADLCLGTFGGSRKATTGISNKIFQILAGGKALVTRDSPAMRELLAPDMPGVFLVPPEDPAALAEALRQAREHLPELRGQRFHLPLLNRLGPQALARRLQSVFNKIIGPNPDTTAR